VSPAASHDTERDLEAPDTDPAREGSEPPEPGSPGENTLLSAGAAARHGLEQRDPRVDDLERRLEQLEARLKVLELARGLGLSGERRWLVWVGVLLALALGWQLRAFFQ